MFTPHPAVDGHIEGDKHAVGEPFMEGLDSGGIVLVVAQGNLFVDQDNGGFVDPAAQGDGSIPIDLSRGLQPEVVV